MKNISTSLSALPDILTAKDIQEYLRVSSEKAYSIMRKEDFPTIQIGRNMRVTKADFLIWLHKQRKGV